VATRVGVLRNRIVFVELCHEFKEEEPDFTAGYLSEVPFLEQVPLPVEVDLLADTWARHRKPDFVEASLLDAAIVYSACETADSCPAGIDAGSLAGPVGRPLQFATREAR
jgi:hypothetical protein